MSSADVSGEHLGDLLSALLDGELAPPEEAAVRTHLQACPNCSGELQRVETARRLVRALPAVDPPFGFLERLVVSPPRLGRHRTSSHRRRAGVAALAASAAAAIGLLGLAPPRDAPVTPSVAQLVEAHATGASVEGDPLSRLAPLGVPVSFGR